MLYGSIKLPFGYVVYCTASLTTIFLFFIYCGRYFIQYESIKSRVCVVILVLRGRYYRPDILRRVSGTRTFRNVVSIVIFAPEYLLYGNYWKVAKLILSFSPVE